MKYWTLSIAYKQGQDSTQMENAYIGGVTKDTFASSLTGK
jgi:hypothetical protein